MPRERASIPNELLYNAVISSRFRTILRFARHLGVSYNALNRYVRLERHPIDDAGFVKPDIAAACEALDAELETLFPMEVLKGHDYRFRDDLPTGSIETTPGKIASRRYAGDRTLSPDQVDALLPLIELQDRVPEENRPGFAEAVVQRLTDTEFALLEDLYFNAVPIGTAADNLGLTVKATRKLEQKALRALNSPKNLKLLQSLKG